MDLGICMSLFVLCVRGEVARKAQHTRLRAPLRALGRGDIVPLRFKAENGRHALLVLSSSTQKPMSASKRIWWPSRRRGASRRI
jgi:hypothetical protein